jgi:adenylate cyclase
MPDLFVIARTSSFPYKGKDADLQKLGQELGVHYFVEGSVGREGDQVQVTARLMDSTTGAEVWSESYTRPLGDIFSLQDNIVQRVVASINPKLAAGDKGATPPASLGTNNLEAYDDYLQGLEYSLSYQTKEANDKERELLEKAIELDPKYGDAYALLGWVYIRDLVNQWNPDPQNWDKASQLEQQAISLDPSNASAYGAMSQLYLLNKQYDQSIAAAQHAVDLEPNAAITHAWLALALAYSGKQEEAIAALKNAERLDPVWEDSYLLGEGGAYNAMGRYEEAVPLLKRYIASFPDDLIAHANLAIAYIELGRQTDAQAEAAEVRRINPQFALVDPKDTALEDVALAQRYNTDLRKAGLK